MSDTVSAPQYVCQYACERGSIELGDGAVCDPTVLLGSRPGRHIEDVSLGRRRA